MHALVTDAADSDSLSSLLDHFVSLVLFMWLVTLVECSWISRRSISSPPPTQMDTLTLGRATGSGAFYFLLCCYMLLPWMDTSHLRQNSYNPGHNPQQYIPDVLVTMSHSGTLNRYKNRMRTGPNPKCIGLDMNR